MARNRRKDPATREEPSASEAGVRKSRKAVEKAATFGLILVAVGLIAPFADVAKLPFFKWVYAAGALVFTIARIVGSTDPDESLRVRRLRRLEFWAGVAFCFGAFFWFYSEHHLPDYYTMGFGLLAYLQNTVYFTLAGAVIQVLAVIFLSNQLKRERSAQDKDKEGRK